MPRFRTLALLPLAILAVALPISAHDFWIETDKGRVEDKQVTLTAVFKIGTAAQPEDWNLRRERVVALRSFGPDDVTDQQAEIVSGEPGSAIIRLQGKGTHIITLESATVESDLPAAQFNEYVEHEGLTAVSEWRASNGQGQMRGRETYSRRAKAIVQLGSRLTDNVTKPLGLGLEIVPEQHPFAIRTSSREKPQVTLLPLRIYFRGKPLAFATVNCEGPDRQAELFRAKTDSDGRTSCPIKPNGRWKISTVWSVPISGNSRAEFDTLFSSLTFEY